MLCHVDTIKKITYLVTLIHLLATVSRHPLSPNSQYPEVLRTFRVIKTKRKQGLFP